MRDKFDQPLPEDKLDHHMFDSQISVTKEDLKPFTDAETGEIYWEEVEASEAFETIIAHYQMSFELDTQDVKDLAREYVGEILK